jgi:tetratricopeptide (TPR) repeat protein
MREGFTEAQYALGAAYFQQHDLNRAIENWEALLRQHPEHVPTQEGLGYAYYMAGDYGNSLKHLRLALDQEPDSVPVLTMTASLLATCPDAILRNGATAIQLADHAKQLTSEQDIAVLDTLSAAYAECKRFDQALQTAQRALDLASKQGDSRLSARLKRHMQSYQSGMPLRDSSDESTL